MLLDKQRAYCGSDPYREHHKTWRRQALHCPAPPRRHRAWMQGHGKVCTRSCKRKCYALDWLWLSQQRSLQIAIREVQLCSAHAFHRGQGLPTTVTYIAVTCLPPARRQVAVEAVPGFREERLRTGRVEAAFLLEDLGAKHRDVTALRYEGCDYQLPLLQANARYRCAGCITLWMSAIRVEGLRLGSELGLGPGYGEPVRQAVLHTDNAAGRGSARRSLARAKTA